MLKRSNSTIDSLVSTIASATVDLNPYHVDAALLAFHLPLSNGALLADEIGLGKTIEAGSVMSQCWAEHKRQSDVFQSIEKQNKEYFLKECEKLDEWSEDLKEDTHRELKELDKEIQEKTKEANAMALLSTLQEMLDAKDKVNMKKLRDQKHRLYDEEDRIAEKNERLQDEMRKILSVEYNLIRFLQSDLKSGD